MGLSLEFFAGEAKEIGAAFTEVEFDTIRDGTKAIAYADFSLHLAIEDLDILSDVAAAHLGREPRFLLDCLISQVGSIEGEGGGAEVVDPAWVGLIATLMEEDSDVLAVQRIKRVGQAQGATLEVTADAIGAIRSLIRLCKLAGSKKADVVFVWYL